MFAGNPTYGGFPTVLFFLVLAWSIFWKGMALWKSARNSQKYWFVALLIFNTLGVLELIYLKFFSKMSILPESSEKKKVLRKRPSKR